MADPIKWKSKIILVKAEGATYGQDANPTGVADAMLLTDVQFQPMEGQDVSRNLELPWMGSQGTIPTGIYGVLTGSVELVGSGTPGVAPAWGVLMRACGVAEVITEDTQVDYSPVSDDHESVSIYFQIGPSRHVLLGSRGTAVLTINAQGIPVIRFTITGLFTVPADAARPATVDLTAWQKPQVASKTNTPTYTIGNIPFVGRSYELSLVNDVQQRLLIGAERIVIVDRAETLSLTVEAVPYATYNPFALALAGTPQEIEIEHGTEAGRIATVTVPTAQPNRPSGFQQNQNVLEWTLPFSPQPVAGDDQWKITLT